MGPTASGKTALAVQLVQQFPCEIISVDSAMVYRGMDIGTAKPDEDTLKIAPHWLINIRDPAEPYSAAQFCEDASHAITDIFSRNKIPLLVGGTMLYFRALQKGLSELPSADAGIRQKILTEAEDLGWPALHDKLLKKDPASAARIHPHDSQRIQRALEVLEMTGQPLSVLHQVKQKKFEDHSIVNIAIAPKDRSILHDRIATRFHQMLAFGFVDEVRALFAREDLSIEMPAIRSAGYRQVWLYLQGKLNYSEMETRGIIATRQLAKRQLTWLRHWPNVIGFDSEAKDLYDQVVKYISQLAMIN
ncbi:MAG: tRNA (adenosine(37)-N6)-dimethylallyltransferase MiaA [Gammaproteobacteria bacterium]|nr:tRNA (adenosine(37)-N6)-dimethylallyltransferase MiaA [Gammaproteobacteria bacterium]